MDSAMPLPLGHSGEVVEDDRAKVLKPIIGAFDAPTAANQAFEAVINLGYDHGDITVVMSEETRLLFTTPSPVTDPTIATQIETDNGPTGDSLTEEDKGETIESKKVLAGAGGMSAIGAVGGALAGLTVNLIAPGVGLLIAGPLAGIGAGFGALIGGIYGVPAVELDSRERIEEFEKEMKAGKVILHVVPRTLEDDALIRSAWRRIEMGE
jgi:hypothetical protein